MARDKPKEIFRARQAFVTNVGGKRRAVALGDLVAEDDPVMKGRAKLFESASDHVERATQAPGERRSVPSHPAAQQQDDTDDDESFDCGDCGETFSTAAALGSHQRVHRNAES